MLNDLYQALILDHSKNPRNFGKVDATHKIDANNPLCGDHLTLYLDVEDNIVRNISFEGDGCAISKASASIMTEVLKDKNIDDILSIVENVNLMFQGKEYQKSDLLKKITALQGVSKYPSRIKCASLSWHAAKAAVEGAGETTTE